MEGFEGSAVKKSDMLIAGFALFAMFFGAGNLIFPPFLGMEGGNRWGIGFLCFILVEVVLTCIGICSMIYAGGSINAMERSVGRLPGFLLNTAAILCTGLLIAPPRTAATTYEMAVVPLTDAIGLFPFSVLFFAVVFVLTIRPAKIVDIVGKFLTPVLIAGIFVLIAAGIVHPVGEIGPAISEHIARDGIVAGYQAMDIISVAGFVIVVQDDLVKCGYRERKEQLRASVYISCIAGLWLALIYGGLIYLGATTSGSFGPGLDQAQLIKEITSRLLGRPGVVLLGIVVGFACLTTAIGLFGATASYFERISKGKIPYKAWIAFLTVVSLGICNLGLNTIISMAVPVLSVVTPPFMTTVCLLAFQDQIKNRNIYRGAAAGAAAASLLIVCQTYGNLFPFVSYLPFYDYGFGWLIPAAIGGLAGKFAGKFVQKCL